MGLYRKSRELLFKEFVHRNYSKQEGVQHKLLSLGPDKLLELDANLSHHEEATTRLGEVLFLASHATAQSFERKILTSLIELSDARGASIYYLSPDLGTAKKISHVGYASAPKKIKLDWDLFENGATRFEKVHRLESHQPFTQALISQGLKGTLFVGIVEGKPAVLWALQNPTVLLTDLLNVLLGLWNFNASRKNQELKLKHRDQEHFQNQKAFLSLLETFQPWVTWDQLKKVKLLKELGLKAVVFIEQDTNKLFSKAQFGFPKKFPKIFKAPPVLKTATKTELNSFNTWIKTHSGVSAQTLPWTFFDLGKKLSLLIIFKEKASQVKFTKQVDTSQFLFDLLRSAIYPVKVPPPKPKISKLPSPKVIKPATQNLLKTIIASKLPPTTPEA